MSRYEQVTDPYSRVHKNWRCRASQRKGLALDWLVACPNWGRKALESPTLEVPIFRFPWASKLTIGYSCWFWLIVIVRYWLGKWEVGKLSYEQSKWETPNSRLLHKTMFRGFCVWDLPTKKGIATECDSAWVIGYPNRSGILNPKKRLFDPRNTSAG